MVYSTAVRTAVVAPFNFVKGNYYFPSHQTFNLRFLASLVFTEKKIERSFLFNGITQAEKQSES